MEIEGAIPAAAGVAMAQAITEQGQRIQELQGALNSMIDLVNALDKDRARLSALIVEHQSKLPVLTGHALHEAYIEVMKTYKPYALAERATWEDVSQSGKQLYGFFAERLTETYIAPLQGVAVAVEK